MGSHNHDLIVVLEPALADLEHWEWLLNLGPDKTSQPAVLILSDDQDADAGDTWGMTVNHETAFDFSARLTRDDEIRSLVVQSNDRGKRLTFSRPNR